MAVEAEGRARWARAWVVRWIAALVVIGVVAFVLAVPDLIESAANGVVPAAPVAVSENAMRLHRSFFVADLHADSLLWGRDLNERSERGHVDVPRLADAGVALQVFSAVTRSPLGQNYERNRSDAGDAITWLAVLSRWPPATWRSLTQRAVYQASRLHQTADLSGGRFRVIENTSDLRRFIDERRQVPSLVAGLLSIEGMHALEGELANLDVLYAAGFRMMGLAHFFDNEVGGSAHGTGRGGLTPFGRQVVQRMEERRILVDLAHASPDLIRDVLAIATRPVVVSHTGIRRTCDNVRNLSDEQIRGIAATGGLIGIGYWDAAVCDVSVAGIARSIRAAVDVVGAEHVALGSDFDGSTQTPFDTTGLPMLTQALLDAGLSEEDVRRIMGGNVERLLARVLPD